MSATAEDLRLLFKEADRRGDRETAIKIMDKLESMQSNIPDDVPIISQSGEISMKGEVKPQEDQSTISDKALGVGEAALTIGSGATGGTLGMGAGFIKQLVEEMRSGQYGTKEAADRIEQESMRMAEEFTYSPRTGKGQEYIKDVGEIAAPLQALGGLTGQMQSMSNIARQSSPLMKDLLKRNPAKKPDQYGAQKSGGAAAVSPEIIRQEKSQSLPVPVNLTKGALIREADQLSFEKELMKSPQLGAPLRVRAEENNLQALHNFDALIDMTGASTPDLTQAGNSVIKALSHGYKAAKKKTNSAYLLAKSSDEARKPVDTSISVTVGTVDEPIVGTVWDYINKKPRGVDSSKVTDSARATALKLGVAAEDADGNLISKPVTVRQIEEFRQELSGMAGFGDKVGLRDETILKKIIDKTAEGTGGKLYKEARKLRTEQSRKYENRAVIARLITNIKGMDDPKVSADMVFRKSILNASPEEVTFLKRVLKTSGKDGNQAWDELRGSTIRHIQDESIKGMGMDSADNPIVSPAKLHRVINQLDSNNRLDIILGKKQADIVRDLNDVVRYVNTVPPGTLINNSGTAGMILAAISEAGAYGMTMNIPLPVITALKFLKDHIENKRIKKKIESALSGMKGKE